MGLVVMLVIHYQSRAECLRFDEIDELLRNGKDWLDTHPEKEFITNRYVGSRKRLARLAFEE